MDITAIFKAFNQCNGVNTDTRTLEKGQLFFALSGPNFNGNRFAKDALKKGAKYVVVDDDAFYDKNSSQYFLVEDTLKALQLLAKMYRQEFNIPFIAITGSNGKTTTKELTHAVLTKKYNVFATKGNYNNHIGVPLTILSIKKDCELAIIEMGANHLDELALLCHIAEPTHGLITNVGMDHLEGYGSIEGVEKGNAELYEYLAKDNKEVFVNSKNEAFKRMWIEGASKITYPSSGDDLECEAIESEILLKVLTEDKTEIQTQLVGSYNLENVAAALCIGKHFNVSFNEMKDAIEAYIPKLNRSQLVKTNTNELILDAYNANPSSMEAAIHNFSQLKRNKKIVILGDMLELGDFSKSEHKNIAALAAKSNFDQIILCGKEFKIAKSIGDNTLYFSSTQDLSDRLKKDPITNASILLKGSRGIGLEKLAEFL